MKISKMSLIISILEKHKFFKTNWTGFCVLLKDLNWRDCLAKKKLIQSMQKSQNIHRHLIKMRRRPHLAEEDTIIMRNSHQKVPQNSSKKIVQKSDNVADCSEIDLKIKENVEVLEDGSRKCALCNKVVPGKSPTNFRNHFERYHMEGLSFDCPNCDKTFRSRGSLSNHKMRYH